MLNPLSSHQFWRVQVRLVRSFSSVIQFAPLVHDEVEHVGRRVNILVGIRHDLVDHVRKEGDVMAGITENVGEEGCVVKLPDQYVFN